MKRRRRSSLRLTSQQNSLSVKSISKIPNKRNSNTSSKEKRKTLHTASATESPLLHSNTGSSTNLLFSLYEDDPDCNHQAVLLQRPSTRNRSPYVGDIQLPNSPNASLVHLPNLDMGGKCVPQSTLLVMPFREKDGTIRSVTATGGKYNTPKCQYKAQLLYVDEQHLVHSQNDDDNHPKLYPKELYPPVWVGAHPSLGERIAEIWLRRNMLQDDGMPLITTVQNQVRNPCGTANIRSDFLLTHQDGTKRIVEVKTVVDTDYSSRYPPPSNRKCRFLSPVEPYHRTAIFPWGNSAQKGPEGEKVVSARAIHHVRELTRIAKGELKGENGELYQATILFVVIRGDAEAFRPNLEACPSFCKYLKIAEESGVQILAKRVRWGCNEEVGMCFSDKVLPIDWPVETQQP